MKIPVTVIKAYPKKNNETAYPVLNSEIADNDIWISIPAEISKTSVCYEIKEIADNTDITKQAEIIKNKPWIRIPKEALNKNPGLHIYQLSFTSDIIRNTDNSFANFNYYFGYIIQTKNVEKSYIYMRHDGTDLTGGNTNSGTSGTLGNSSSGNNSASGNSGNNSESNNENSGAQNTDKGQSIPLK